MLKEIKRLYDLGFGVHLLQPKSKAPLGKWNTVEREDFETLKKLYKPHYNLGIRLGQASKVGGGFLAAFDIDVKSKDPKHLKEALTWIKNHVPGIDLTPYDLSGRGNGSRHCLVIVSKPENSWKLISSPEMVQVHMPSVSPTKHQMELLGEKKIKEGVRLRPAWEIEFMCMGKQIAIPPSVHPDTGKHYTWGIGFENASEFLVLEEQVLESLREKRVGKTTVSNRRLKNFQALDVDLDLTGLKPDVVERIQSGDGVEDRSSECMSVCMKMVRLGLSDNEILSVLTDRNLFLGETAFDHAKTEDRGRAALWVMKYCLEPAKHQMSAARAFEDEVIVDLPPLSEEEALEQVLRLCDKSDWRDELSRTGGGDPEAPPKATFENVVLVIENACGEDVAVIKRDTFASRDFYGCDTPWGGKAGECITDDDAIRIKAYCTDFFRFEPSVSLIFEVLTCVAMKNAFHPVREAHLNRVPWDGEGRLSTWLKVNFEAEGPDEYLDQVFTKWLVASITRVFRPGAKFDWMPIFEGMQGVGKSSFGSILFGEKFFSDWLPRLEDKDAAINLQGILCNEFGELSNFKKSEIETVKAFITRQVDKVRPPYGRKQIEIARQCVFFGTTNQDKFLRDDTGNRRFIPVKVGRLNFEALRRDCVQLWAEAFFLFQNDLVGSLDMVGVAKTYAEKIQKMKMVDDESELMKEELVVFFQNQKRLPKEERLDMEKIRISDLFGRGVSGAFLAGSGGPPLATWKYDSRNSQFAGKALRILGFTTYKSNGVRFFKKPVPF